MRKLLMVAAAVAAASLAAPIAASAQVVLEGPGVGLRIGEPEHYYHPSWGYAAPRYRSYEEPVVVERRVYRDDRREWRDRDVGLRRWNRSERWDRD